MARRAVNFRAVGFCPASISAELAVARTRVIRKAVPSGTVLLVKSDCASMPEWEMASLGRAGLLQLPRSSGKLEPIMLISQSGDSTLARGTPAPGPKAPAQLGPNGTFGPTMAPGSACAPSLSRCALRRAASEIRTVCANECPYGSVRGISGNRYPYRDRR